MRNRFLGGTLIIASTCIGAGMLVLPLVAAATGFWASVVLMGLVWALAAYGGLLLTEACQACPQADNLHGMTGQLLGKAGQWVAMIALLCLFYTLCAAYITGGTGQLLALLAQHGWLIAPWQAALLITGTVGVITVIGTTLVDGVNRLLFMVMLALFAWLLVGLLPHVQGDYLMAGSVTHGLTSGAWLAALPILYTSFGYHGTVPSVAGYMAGQPSRLRPALLLGSGLPLIIYWLWQWSANGTLPPDTVRAAAASPRAVASLVAALGHVADSEAMHGIVNRFATLALATSFLGVALGLFDYLAEACRRRNTLVGRGQTLLLTLAPPLAVALWAPDSFVMALGYAAVALVVLAIYLPVAMAWQIRRRQRRDGRVVSGYAGLVLAGVMGSLIIIAQLGVVTGLLPALG